MKYLILLTLINFSIITIGCNDPIKSSSFAMTINDDTYSIVKYGNGNYKVRPFGKNYMMINNFAEVMSETILKYPKCSNFTFYKGECRYYESDSYYAQKVLYQLLENNPAMCENGLLTLH